MFSDLISIGVRHTTYAIKKTQDQCKMTAGHIKYDSTFELHFCVPTVHQFWKYEIAHMWTVWVKDLGESMFT